MPTLEEAIAQLQPEALTRAQAAAALEIYASLLRGQQVPPDACQAARVDPERLNRSAELAYFAVDYIARCWPGLHELLQAFYVPYGLRDITSERTQALLRRALAGALASPDGQPLLASVMTTLPIAGATIHAFLPRDPAIFSDTCCLDLGWLPGTYSKRPHPMDARRVLLQQFLRADARNRLLVEVTPYGDRKAVVPTKLEGVLKFKRRDLSAVAHLTQDFDDWIDSPHELRWGRWDANFLIEGSELPPTGTDCSLDDLAAAVRGVLFSAFDDETWLLYTPRGRLPLQPPEGSKPISKHAFLPLAFISTKLAREGRLSCEAAKAVDQAE